MTITPRGVLHRPDDVVRLISRSAGTVSLTPPWSCLGGALDVTPVWPGSPLGAIIGDPWLNEGTTE